MFAVTAVLTAIGAASPAACAIVGPIALGFAGRHRISPLMMGMFVVHGAQAGGFSPISIYGVITNSVMAENNLPVNELAIFLSSLLVNLAIAIALFFALGGRQLASRRVGHDETSGRDRRSDAVGSAGTGPTEPAAAPRRPRRPVVADGDRDRAGRPPRGPAAAGRPDHHARRVRRGGVRRAGVRAQHRVRGHHRRGDPDRAVPQGAEGCDQADRLVDRAVGGRGQHASRRS